MGMRLRTSTPIAFKHLSLKGLLVMSLTLYSSRKARRTQEWVRVSNRQEGGDPSEQFVLYTHNQDAKRDMLVPEQLHAQGAEAITSTHPRPSRGRTVTGLKNVRATRRILCTGATCNLHDQDIEAGTIGQGHTRPSLVALSTPQK